MTWTYSITGGVLTDGSRNIPCYSGHLSPYRDNPALVGVHGMGPIPPGRYSIGDTQEHTHLGPLAIPLIPCAENEMYGRSGFYIHADSIEHPGDASDGCVVTCGPEQHNDREYITRSGERDLIVSP